LIIDQVTRPLVIDFIGQALTILFGTRGRVRARAGFKTPEEPF